jgi:iron(III) transport system ATP-binding protein
VVLLDEPFSSLDAALRLSAGREVTAVLRNAGSTALLVTHDQGEALSLADRVAVMDDGVICQVATPGQLYGAPVDPRVGRFVGDANLLPGELRGDAVHCALGRVAMPRRPPGEDGTRVTLLVRPEQLRLDTSPGAVTALVVEVVFYGPHASVRLSTSEGTTLLVRVDPAHVPSVGDEVGVVVTGTSGVFS